jgi:OOP family OmpA-OmpF porin
MKKIVFAAAAAVTVAGAFAQTNSTGYWKDSGGVIARNSYGECWRAGYWTPALAIPECEPGMVKPVAAPVPAPAPVVVAPKPAPAPAPVVAPPPPPVVVAPPPPPPPPPPAPKAAKKIALNAATSFAVAKADLTAEGKAAVDKEVLSKLDGFSKIESVSIEGHADPMGKEEANRTLSKNRAEAVKAYMVSKGISADVIKTEGKGSSVPAAGVNCSPKLPKAKLSACYAPHRRIEIDVKGEAK